MPDVKVPEHALRDLVGSALALAAFLDCEDLPGGEVAEAGLRWLARHLADTAEAAAALAEERPPRWHVLMDARATITEMKRRNLLLPEHNLPVAAE